MARGLKDRLGEEVVARRDAREWTRENLVEHSGVSVNTIGNIERGQGNPGLDTLEKLARAFRLSVGELLTASERRP
jgi:XRE family transcriptional regulator, regulator of sulfur utilization